METTYHFNDIPEEFYSFNTGQPFCECSDCGKNLLKPGTIYVIEKAIRQYAGYTAKDIIFEVAICLECVERMKNEISTESMNNMMKFYEEMILNRMEREADFSMTKCVATGIPREKLTNYQINALCDGSKLSPLQSPYLVSGAVLDEMNDILSDKTRDFLDDYQQRFIGPSPEWVTDDVPGGKFVLI